MLISTPSPKATPPLAPSSSASSRTRTRRPDGFSQESRARSASQHRAPSASQITHSCAASAVREVVRSRSSRRTARRPLDSSTRPSPPSSSHSSATVPRSSARRSGIPPSRRQSPPSASPAQSPSSAVQHHASPSSCGAAGGCQRIQRRAGPSASIHCTAGVPSVVPRHAAMSRTPASGTRSSTAPDVSTRITSRGASARGSVARKTK